jgi:hypothetical protein
MPTVSWIVIGVAVVAIVVLVVMKRGGAAK